MKKKSQDKGPRKLQLHRETVQTLMVVGGEFSVTCVTCPDQTGSAGCAGGCPASS